MNYNQECILEEVVENKDGNFYFIYKLPKVKRGMHGKTKGNVDELLIVGVNRKNFNSYCEKEGLQLRLENLKDYEH